MTDTTKINHLIPGLRRYQDERILPGAFLASVLRNDLYDAVVNAADTDCFCRLLRWIYDNLPAESHGSVQAVNAWLDGAKEEA